MRYSWMNSKFMTTTIFGFIITILSSTIAYSADTKGIASYYGYELKGRRTASGERFNPVGLTAAHRSLPFGTKLKVTNLRNGKAVIVRVSDRGPFTKGRMIDLSYGAARAIGMIGSGTARVAITPLGRR